MALSALQKVALGLVVLSTACFSAMFLLAPALPGLAIAALLLLGMVSNVSIVILLILIHRARLKGAAGLRVVLAGSIFGFVWWYFLARLLLRQ